MRWPFAAVLLVVAGCSTAPIVLEAPTYASKVVVASEKTARVSFITGEIGGKSSSMIMPVVGTGVFIPVSHGPVARLMFDAEDQRIFTEALRSELVRLGIFRSASSSGDASADILITLDFKRTEHSPTFQSYLLEVSMRLSGNGTVSETHYRILSDEGEGFWEKSNTNAKEGKAKAGRKLMASLVPDIERYMQKQ